MEMSVNLDFKGEIGKVRNANRYGFWKILPWESRKRRSLDLKKKVTKLYLSYDILYRLQKIREMEIIYFGLQWGEDFECKSTPLPHQEVAASPSNFFFWGGVAVKQANGTSSEFGL